VRVTVLHPILPPAVELLSERGYELTVGEKNTPYAPDELHALVAGADGIIALLLDPVDDGLFDTAGPQLKVVANMAVGYDNVDLASARRRGVKIANTPDVLTEAVAEHTFALILAVARRIVESDRFVRSGGWRGWDPQLLLGTELHGKILGIVGPGRIGRAVGRIGESFGMKVLYARRPEELEQLLAQADVVSLHVPLRDETRHRIGASEIARMKETAILVNTSRGEVVDEGALLAALVNGAIAGAGLDVFESEPDPLPGLLALENVVLTPHTASATVETRRAMSRLAAENVIAALEGRELPSEVSV
jgi:glyoxylate reductase